MSMGKKIAIGAVAAGAIYAAGEEWIWGGKGGRHQDTSTPPVQEIENQTVVDISNNSGSVDGVIIRDDADAGI
jgi:hypothetical protein